MTKTYYFNILYIQVYTTYYIQVHIYIAWKECDPEKAAQVRIDYR